MPKRILDNKRYVVDDQTGCWNYNMGCFSDGYGAYSLYLGEKRYKTVRAHSYYYEKHKGKIKEGFILDHLCRNKICCNPDHLEEVVPATNVRRGFATKLTDNKVSNIRKMYSVGVNQIVLAGIFGVNQSEISRVINHKRWI